MSDLLKYGKPKGKAVEYLNRYFLSEFRTGYVTCKEVVVPEYFTQFGDRIRQMDIRYDDIWVCSYPKTGTTWVQEMVWCIANDVNLEAAEESLQTRVPFLDETPLFDFRTLKNLDLGIDVNGFDSVSFIIDLPSPRFVKSHLPFNLLPEKLQRSDTTAKIIYVARNPRDTCISYYHHCRNIEGYSGNFEQFCELFLEGNLPYGSFWNHVRSYWDFRDEKNVLILKYEDMRKDLKSVVRQVANFLKKSLNEDQIAKLLDHLSFEKMKQNAAVNKQPEWDILRRIGVLSDKHEDFFRSGKVDEWKAVMDEKLMQRFEKWQQKNLGNADETFIKFFDYKV